VLEAEQAEILDQAAGETLLTETITLLRRAVLIPWLLAQVEVLGIQ
jgi:hypothetical protein